MRNRERKIRTSEPEITPVVLFDQAQILEHYISYFFIWHIENFSVDQFISNGSGFRRSIVHQIFFERHQCVGVAAVLDLSALAQRHEPVSGAPFPITGGAEAGNVIHLHQPPYDFIQSTVIAYIELFRTFILRFRLVVAAHAGTGAAADLRDAQMERSFTAAFVLACGDDHAGVRNGDADACDDL